MTDTTKPAQRVTLTAPNGRPILGTLERLTARAEVESWTVEPDGSLTANWIGDTKVFWDGQHTETDDEGRDILLDDMGNEWTADDCEATIITREG